MMLKNFIKTEGVIMKCAACGYEGEFNKTWLYGFITPIGSPIPVWAILYACPKCGTVRIDKENN